MTKRDLKLLERIFAAEIESSLRPTGKMPCQIKGTRIEELEREGYVVKVETVLPGRFPVRVKGWALTWLGNFTCCQSCK